MAEEQRQEKTFLSENGVVVTNARIVARGQTYAMSGVTSVKTAIESPNSGFPVLLLVLGILLTFGGFAGGHYQVGAAGLLVGGLGVLVLKSMKPTHYLVLTTASGEVKAINSGDQGFIQRALQAVNNAIISRS